MAIDEETLKHYLADNPPSVVPLKIKPHFDALSDEEKLYAHYISKYCHAPSLTPSDTNFLQSLLRWNPYRPPPM
jgi:hypothetical protein